MTVADIIDAAIRIYRHHFGPLLGVAAVVQVPMLVIQLAAVFLFTTALASAEGEQFPAEQLALGALWGLGALLVALILFPLGEAAMVIAVSDCYLGQPVTVWGSYRRAVPFWGRVLVTSILYWLWAYVWVILGTALLIGAMAALLPSIEGGTEQEALALGVLVLAIFFVGVVAATGVVWALIRYLLAPSVLVVLEGQSGVAAMQRSAQLVRGFFWSVLATMAILTIMVVVGTQAVTLPVQIGLIIASGQAGASEQWLPLAQLVGQAIAATIAVVLRPLPMIAIVLVYYDLRIRKEGFDLMMMAEALGLPATFPQPAAPQEQTLFVPQAPPDLTPTSQPPPKWPSSEDPPASEAGPVPRQ